MKNLLASAILSFTLVGTSLAPVSFSINNPIIKVTPESIAIDGPTILHEYVNNYYKFTAKVFPEGAEQEVTWSSDNVDIHINNDGIVTYVGPAAGEKTCNIIATSTVNPQIKASFQVTHKWTQPPTSIQISAPSDTVIGATEQLSVNVTPDTGCDEVFYYLTEDTKDLGELGLTSGEFIPKKCGTAKIYAKSAHMLSSLQAEEISIKISNPKISGPTNNTLRVTDTFNYSVKPDNSISSSFEWSVDDTNIATIDPFTGKLEAVYEGTTLVRAKSKIDPTITLEQELNVILVPITLSIDGPDIVEVSAHKAFVANINPKRAPKKVDWSIETDPETGGQGTIDTNGVLTPTKIGKLTIIAKCTDYPDVKNQKEIEVIPYQPHKIKIDGRKMYRIDETSTLVAKDDDDVGIEPTVTWKSRNTDVVTIDKDTGKIRTVGEGKAIIEAVSIYDSTVRATFEVLVSNKYHSFKFNPIIGNGMTFSHDEMVNEDEDFNVKFISALYDIDPKQYPRDIHKEVKLSDIEVFSDSSDITSKCSIDHNVLTIPKKYTNKNISINYLGAEIADWISWNHIREISEKDAESDKQIAKKYLTLGDYKKTYQKNKFSGTARLIDVYHDEYLRQGTHGTYNEACPTTWEIFDKPYTDSMWGWPDTIMEEVEPWDEDSCIARLSLVAVSYDGLIPRQTTKYSCGTGSHRSYDEFFILSYGELTGEDYEYHHPDWEDVDGPQYAYYDTSEYHCTKSLDERMKRKNCSGTDDLYMTRTIYEKEIITYELWRQGPVCIDAEDVSVHAAFRDKEYSMYLAFTI